MRAEIRQMILGVFFIAVEMINKKLDCRRFTWNVLLADFLLISNIRHEEFCYQKF